MSARRSLAAALFLLGIFSLALSGQAAKPVPDPAGPTQAVSSPAAAAPGAYTHEQQYLFDIFRNRRSVRKYLPTPVPEEHLRQILDIARTAPTSGNQQPWKFLVIRDRAKLQRLLDATVEYYAAQYREKKKPTDAELAEFRDKIRKMDTPYLGAPVFVVVLTDSQSQYPTYNHFDGPMAAVCLFVAARALGYGTVFCTDSFPFEVVKQVFAIPDRYEVVCSTPLGVPDGWPVSKEKKPLESFVAFEKLE
jgi:nitroreductase